MKMNRSLKIASGILMLVLGISLLVNQGIVPALSRTALNFPDLGLFEQELTNGEYYTIVNPEGKVLDKTVRVVYVGDEFIAEDNVHYRVSRVEGTRAIAESIGKEDIVWKDEWDTTDPQVQAVQTGKAKNLVAIYHTHSDESYIPSDGKESIPARGGIFKVGDVLASKLKALGVNVRHDTTPHEPHDANAYRRSRRTAYRLLQEGPSALIDVHRDGVPDPDFYNSNVAGENVTRIRMVVGRQNPNMSANLDFAKRMKAALDKSHPGLVRGIFMAKGGYNQDMTPRALLIEAGTHTNTRSRAQRGVGLFADAVPKVLGITAARAPGVAPLTTSGGDMRSIYLVLAIVLLGGGAFLLVSTGSVKGAVDKLKQATSIEWANFLGQRKKGSSTSESRMPQQLYPEQQDASKKSDDLNDERAPYQKD
ncbi:MAG: stage II sporulation protein P [Bacillota bacterium]